jgi:hypothetical protein
MKRMNKRAAVGPIGAIMLFIVFLIMWFVWLGSWVNQVGLYAIESGQYTGFELFFYSNLNFVIFICMILGMLGFMYFGSGSE